MRKALMILTMAVAIVSLAVVSGGAGFAYALPDVTVTGAVLTPKDGEISLDVIVVFENEHVYNDGVYLSYHVLNQNGEMLQFENTRYPLTVHNGRAEQTIRVSVADLPADAHLKTTVLQLDLVDTQNVFWFSENENIVTKMDVVSFESVEMDESMSGDMKQVVTQGRAEKICVIFINVAGITGLCALLWLMRKDISKGG